jgi:hypothetical protein
VSLKSQKSAIFEPFWPQKALILALFFTVLTLCRGLKYVIYRKTSYFAWSERSERDIERMLSLFLTYQKDSPFQKLLQILKPAPALIPLA